jgi:hypothetical protein
MAQQWFIFPCPDYPETHVIVQLSQITAILDCEEQSVIRTADQQQYGIEPEDLLKLKRLLDHFGPR